MEVRENFSKIAQVKKKSGKFIFSQSEMLKFLHFGGSMLTDLPQVLGPSPKFKLGHGKVREFS